MVKMMKEKAMMKKKMQHGASLLQEQTSQTSHEHNRQDIEDA